VALIIIIIIRIIDTHGTFIIDITYKTYWNATMIPMAMMMWLITTSKRKMRRRRRRSITYACACIANRKRRTRRIYRSDVMNARRTYVMIVTGVMNIKRITKYGSVIGVMDFIAGTVTRWISVMIVMRWSVRPVPHCYPVNFVVEVYVKIVPLLVDGT
jgi:hypothetical protein